VCHAEGTHLATDHWFGLLKQYFVGSQCHHNSTETETGVQKTLQIPLWCQSGTNALMRHGTMLKNKNT
jgi:hypothetical protein